MGMGKRLRESYEKKQARLNSQREEKERDLSNLIDALDRVAKKALKSNAYHAGELEDLNRARHSLFSVRAGCSRRVRR